MNNISIMGNLTRDYELKYTSGGKPVGSFSIAVQDGWGDNEHTSFFDVTVFGPRAEAHANFIRKGSKVGVTGAIRQDRWEAQDGTKRNAVKIIANNIDYLDSKPKGDTSDSSEFNQVADSDIPF